MSDARDLCAAAAHLPLIALVAIGSACGDTPGPGPVVRDSAGVRIVDNEAPDWATGEAWLVGPEPTLSLGTTDNPPELSFSQVAGAYRLGDGTLVVVDGSSGEVRFFDAAGEHARSFGRTGQGPGEFERMEGVGVRSDSVWIYDGSTSRLTGVGATSDGYRTVPVEAQNLALGAVGLLPDGTFVLASDLSYTSAITDSLPAGLHRFGAAYVWVSAAGTTLDTILIAPGSERVLSYGGNTLQMLRPLFARSVSHALVADRLLFGDQERYEIRSHRLDGTLVGIARRLDVDLTLSEQEYATAIEARLQGAPSPARPGLRAMYEGQPRPGTRPAFGRFLADPTGHLWVQDFALDGMAPIWSVFALDGAWLGDIELPERFAPTQILDEEVIGVWRDELDVEHVRVYPLDRSDGGGGAPAGGAAAAGVGGGY